jgi:acyl carrier protein
METTRDRIIRVVSTSLKLPQDDVSEALAVGDISSWDSLGHVMLLQQLEQEFALTLDIDDALSIESVSDILVLFERLTTKT